MRTLIDLPESQIQELSKLCAEIKISRAEAVRRAVAAYLAENRAEPDDDVFGLWAGRGLDGLKYQEDMRSDWDR